jgi:predicted outer membrane protein
VAGHDNTVLAFQNATTQAEDADIQAFAKKHLVTLRDHLDAARQIGPTDHGM